MKVLNSIQFNSIQFISGNMANKTHRRNTKIDRYTTKHRKCDKTQESGMWDHNAVFDLSRSSWIYYASIDYLDIIVD